MIIFFSKFVYRKSFKENSKESLMLDLNPIMKTLQMENNEAD